MQHLDMHDILDILLKLGNSERKTLVNWIINYGDSKYHSDVAEMQLQNLVCMHCGELLERENDDDRYYYICPNTECDCYK